MPEDFKQAIEQIKLRIPVEDVVRERVPGLKKAGALWVACCPFHDERTPSFKVDPRRGSWRCYGACGTGGDVIAFLERHDNLSFLEALEILASRAGVELPRGRAAHERADPDERAALYDVLGRAADFYRRMLQRPDGAPAREYLSRRGLTATTLDAFGIGFSPAAGEVLISRAVESGQPLEPLLETGLARRNDQGRPYDFFRGRLMVPIRDDKGRTVGFGARRLSDADPSVPKYINTPETPLFHKGRLVYALDFALEHVRKSGHLVLVEGYTDVMAAHQVGVRNVVAVLGTATTDEHAALVRRSGARRVTLCFDGDAAGAQATYRALTGLLSLEIEIDVVRLAFDPRPSDSQFASIKDPCDLLVLRGAAPFLELLAGARNWFDFVLESLLALPAHARWPEVDRALELIGRLRRPMQRDARLAQLAGALGHPVEVVREQFEGLPARLRERRRAEEERALRSAKSPAKAPVATGAAAERLARRSKAWRDLTGAVLREPALLASARPYTAICDDPGMRDVLEALAALADRRSAIAGQVTPASPVTVEDLLAELGEHRSCDLVYALLSEAERAESAQTLLDGALERLWKELQEERVDELKLELSGAPEHEQARILAEIHVIRQRELKTRDAGALLAGVRGTPPARERESSPARERESTIGTTHV